MHTKILMICSAVVLFGLGMLLTFAPRELLVDTGNIPQPLLVLMMQATGALYLGFAGLNWMAKDNLIGGIYSRPVAIGNFLHFVVFSMAIVKACTAGHRENLLALAAIVYVLFAIWFGLVTFGSPIKRAQRMDR